jgi:hypothetical protein
MVMVVMAACTGPHHSMVCGYAGWCDASNAVVYLPLHHIILKTLAFGMRENAWQCWGMRGRHSPDHSMVGPNS